MNTMPTKIMCFALIFLSTVLCAKENPLKNKNGKRDNPRPNIVFIVSDSHRAEALGVMGNPFVKTPHLDQLAERGMLFTQAYVTTAICAVSRASLFSGQYQQRHQINDFTTSFSPEALSNTFPLLLGSSGYQTASIGFWGIGKESPGAHFDYWKDDMPWMTSDGKHHTDQIKEEALAYLENQSSDEPFYLYLGFKAAHEIDGVGGLPPTYLIQERFKDLYATQEIPVPETAKPVYWNSFPDFFRTDQNIGRARWKDFLSTPELFQENAKNYYRLVTGVDDAIGAVIEKLEALGMADNTIIIYTADHGFSLGEQGMMGKWHGFESSIHVPMIIADLRPSAKAQPIKSSKLALNIDVAPTILDFAGVSIPASMQGISLLDLVSGVKAERAHFFYEHTVFSSPLLAKVEGIVTKEDKYLLYIEDDYEALYDLKRDPKETKNLASDPRYKKRLEQMRAIYADDKVKLK